MFTSIPKETRIVIIDDITANMRLLESSTRAFGLHHVQGFSDSAEGLEWLIHNPWDLLILDLDMPAPDGFEILRRLGDRNRSRRPVIILTALGDPESRRRGFELGANDYLTKPVDLPELLLRIRNCLQLAYATEHLENMNQDLEAKVRTRTAQLKESYRAGIRALSRAACYRDNDTGDHILRIGEFAALLAATIGMPESWCETLRLAAPMHDLGKIGIADSILLKEGPLTLEERTAMMEHPRIGYSILHEEGGTELIDMAAEIAYCHHEKWDGSGYPRGLAGDAIPLAARIVALCDVYDALRMDRPYKRAWSPERAQAHILEQSGRHFDPQLVEALQTRFADIEALLEDRDEALHAHIV
ncbi:HD domain-containing phosphohydrolase [Pseudomonas solani]|uniref:HD domain-containing phosphohydrolase n=1 Tax=Pseudomonas solani TaxID=2731552 RepID=UPI003D6A0D6D